MYVEYRPLSRCHEWKTPAAALVPTRARSASVSTVRRRLPVPAGGLPGPSTTVAVAPAVVSGSTRQPPSGSECTTSAYAGAARTTTATAATTANTLRICENVLIVGPSSCLRHAPGRIYDG